jgi:hypothetical protein
MATKFSEFTAGATTANTFIVGFDSNLNTNNKYTLDQLKTGLNISNIYTANGNIVEDRIINDRAEFTNSNDVGKKVIKMNVRNSGALMVAGYLSNGNPGQSNNCFRWGPGTTAGGMNVRGNLALDSSGGGAINLTGSSGQFFTITQSGTAINTNVSIGSASFASEKLEVNGNTKITGQVYNSSIPVASGSGTTTITPDWNSGNIQECTLTASTAHTLANATNLKPGATYILIVKQAAGGSGTISSYGTQYEFPDATAPTLTTDGNKADVFTLIAANANTLLCTSVLKFTIN